MIKLMLFVPCEKVIIGQDNRTSLISVLEHLTLRGEIVDTLPPKAVLPFKWEIVTLWHRPNEIGEPVEFNSRVEVLSPDGALAIQGDVSFIISDEFINFRQSFDFPVFPISQAGIYKLMLSYKRSDSEDWEIVGEYSIRVIHELKESKNEGEVENRIEVENEPPTQPV